jgi:hypothetical protein
MSYFDEEAKRMFALNKHKHMNSDKSIGVAFLIFLGVLVLLPLAWLYGVFSYGFVAVKLWTWFVVPVFHTTVNFGILQAARLCILVRFFTSEHKMSVSDPDETTEHKIASIILPLIVPWVTLLFGWLLKSIM